MVQCPCHRATIRSPKRFAFAASFAARVPRRARSKPLQDTTCIYCGHSFHFDPVLFTPSNEEDSLPSGPDTVVLPCPKCRQWLIVTVRDEQQLAGPRARVEDCADGKSIQKRRSMS